MLALNKKFSHRSPEWGESQLPWLSRRLAGLSQASEGCKQRLLSKRHLRQIRQTFAIFGLNGFLVNAVELLKLRFYRGYIHIGHRQQLAVEPLPITLWPTSIL